MDTNMNYDNMNVNNNINQYKDNSFDKVIEKEVNFEAITSYEDGIGNGSRDEYGDGNEDGVWFVSKKGIRGIKQNS